jgi:TfoX/Sxy family transcriptional regulator of competence genes
MPMRFEKAPPELVALFDEVIAPAGAERRQMFGYPCAFVNGNMCTGLFADALFVRLGDDERAALLREPGARVFEPMPGRPMKEYAVIPPALLADRAALGRWIARAVAYARELPAKRAKRAAPTKRGAAPKRGAGAKGKTPAKRGAAGGGDGSGA